MAVIFVLIATQSLCEDQINRCEGLLQLYHGQHFLIIQEPGSINLYVHSSPHPHVTPSFIKIHSTLPKGSFHFWIIQEPDLILFFHWLIWGDLPESKPAHRL